MNDIIRNPDLLNDETKSLWVKQEGIIVIYRLPFQLFETRRSPERQKYLFSIGATKIEDATGNHCTGDAWDVAKWGKDGWSWKDEDVFWYQVLGILTVNLIANIKWGADWNGKNFWYDEKFRDYGHYERVRI